ncbi:tetratricopeptide repeat protein 27-like isoform X2 [Dysidea avara]|uniref:tetratricopeptide repeat protein 27-like isoform X2 n=1 Tax=Dysidea avara TaxID=196820 RepID=UPI003320348E
MVSPMLPRKKCVIRRHGSCQGNITVCSLGMLYLHKEKYKECVESLRLSLVISSLQEGVWFSLGHAALKLANHDLAVKAFRRMLRPGTTYQQFI